MNLNKLFPRLTISAKLAIAFLLLAALPAIAVATVSAFSVAAERRAQAESVVRFDLDRAELRLTRALEEAQQTVDLLRAGFVEPWILGERGPDEAQVTRIAALGLGSHRSAVFRIKVFGPAGDPLLELGRDGSVAFAQDLDQNGGFFYVLAAELAADSDAVYVPVELRDVGIANMTSSNGVVPAVAIVEAMRAPDGSLLAVIVGEAEAAPLFADLEESSPGLEGTTALVRQDGLFLFHSEHKRDWSSLLDSEGAEMLEADLGEALAYLVTSGAAGSERGDRHFVEFRPIEVGAPQDSPLILYRSVPNATILAPVRAFLLRVAGAGILLLMGVLGLAVFAARQLTKPIYELQRAAHELADGRMPGPLNLETNDELEDLAEDFSVMAARLSEARQELEDTVDRRTRALEMTRAELSEVITNSADAIIGLDQQGRVRLWNHGARDLFGYQPDEAIGNTVDELLGPPDQAVVRERRSIQRELERSGAVVNLRTTRRNRDGESIPITLTQTVIEDGAGKPLGSSLILRDDRMHAKLEEHMRRSERLAAVSIMAAGLAHEINNPLSVLGNRIELMRREAARHDVGAHLERDIEVVGEKVARIRDITTDLLSFAREGNSQPVDFSIKQVIERLIRLFHRSLAAQGVEVRLEVPEGLPKLRGNTTAVETVVANLILNAQQAMPEGGVIGVRVMATEIEQPHMILEVTDDGPGIPPEVRTRVFEPFFTTKGERGGTGLGLAVCRALVERQGGRISLSPNESRGARFTVEFPLPATA